MKKTIYQILIIFIISSFSYVLLKNLFFPCLVVFLYLIIIILKNSDNKKRILKLKEEREYEFANMLSYLLVFLENNFNVYQSLQMTMNFTKDILIKDIEELIEQIDLDKSITPYQHFADKFDSNIVYQVVMMIYQLDVNGYDAKYLASFPNLITDLRQTRIENMINARKTNMSFMTVVPIIALLSVVFVFIFYILKLVGGL